MVQRHSITCYTLDHLLYRIECVTSLWATHLMANSLRILCGVFDGNRGVISPCLVSARELLLSSHKIIYSCNTIHTYRSTILIGLAILFIDQLNQFIAAVRRYIDTNCSLTLLFSTMAGLTKSYVVVAVDWANNNMYCVWYGSKQRRRNNDEWNISSGNPEGII